MTAAIPRIRPPARARNDRRGPAGPDDPRVRMVQAKPHGVVDNGLRRLLPAFELRYTGFSRAALDRMKPADDLEKHLADHDKSLGATFHTIRTQCSKLQDRWCAHWPEGNDHGPGHIGRVLDNLAALVGHEPISAGRMSPLELAISMTAVVAHDIGIVDGREGHAEVSAKMIAAMAGENPLLFDKWSKPILVAAIRCHGSSFDIESECRRFSHEKEIGGYRVRTRLPAALVRLADELDEDHRRADEFVEKYSKIPLSSAPYWRFCQRISGIKFGEAGGDITIYAQLESGELRGEPTALGARPFLEFFAEKLVKINRERAKMSQFLGPMFARRRLSIVMEPPPGLPKFEKPKSFDFNDDDMAGGEASEHEAAHRFVEMFRRLAQGGPISVSMAFEPQSPGAGSALVRVLVRDFGLDIHPCQFEPGSSLHCYELPELQYRRLRQLLDDHNTELTQTLAEHRVTAINGVGLPPFRGLPLPTIPAVRSTIADAAPISVTPSDRPILSVTGCAPNLARAPVRSSIFSRLLDRSKAWNLLIDRCRTDKGSLAILVHGQGNQDLPLFLERIYRHFNEDAEDVPHHVHDIALEEDGGQPQTAAEWEARLRQSAGYPGKWKTHYVLKQSLAKDPGIFMIHGADYGPLRALEPQVLAALVEFLSATLPAALGKIRPHARPLRILLPVEHETVDHTIDSVWKALDGALKLAEARGLSYLCLPELTVPIWKEVQDSIVAFLADREICDYSPDVLERCRQVYLRQPAHPIFSVLADGIAETLDPLIRAKAQATLRP